MNFQMFKLIFKKAEETEIKLPTSAGTLKKQEFQKNIYFCLIDYAKAFDCVDHNKLWKILKEVGIPDHLTCLLWNLYAGEEATARTGHGCGRRQGWDVLREQHWNKYTIKGEIDHQPRLDAWDKCSGLVHWEDPEGWDGEGGRRGDRDGEHM